MLAELLSFAAGLGTGIGGMIALGAMRRAETRPIPSDWIPKEHPILQFNLVEEIKAATPNRVYATGIRSPYAPKLRGQDPYIPILGKPSARSTRTRLPHIPWGTK